MRGGAVPGAPRAESAHISWDRFAYVQALNGTASEGKLGCSVALMKGSSPNEVYRGGTTRNDGSAHRDCLVEGVAYTRPVGSALVISVEVVVH